MLKARSRCSDVRVWSYGGMEVWGSGGSMRECGHGDMEVWSVGVTELSGRLSASPPQPTLQII